jgi:MFS superfamily sulfate permease-like transporter
VFHASMWHSSCRIKVFSDTFNGLSSIFVILKIIFVRNYFAHLKNDLPAGVVVFLVALPLCLGIALASGAPFFSGMIAGIIGGIVIGIISDGQLSVSGPAAGLTAVVLTSISKLGAFEVFLLAVVLAGVGQILLGLVKAGRIAEYFPSNVIKGMLTAIGVIIILKQIPHAFGYDKDTEGDMYFQQADNQNTFSELFQVIGHVDLSATILCLLSLAIIIVWNVPLMKKKVGMVPGGLVAVVVSVLVSEFVMKGWEGHEIAAEHLVNVPVANSFSEFLGFFKFPDFSMLGNPAVYSVAFTVMAVASIETLLCIEAVDKIDPEKRITTGNRELVAQGVGNIMSGLIGGLPVTSVIVRSSANLQANAKSKVSTIFHGVLLLVCVIFIPTILNKIPLAALAAILLYTGYKLCNPATFAEMYRNGKYQFIPFIVTVVAVVFTDLLTGVGIGLIVSIFAILIGNFKTTYFIKEHSESVGDPIQVELAQEVSFLNKASLREFLNGIPERSKIILDGSASVYIDFDVLEIIRDFQTVKAPLKNIQCETKGFAPEFQIKNTIQK